MIPREFWGSEHNLLIFEKKVYLFVCMGRYESMSLHQVMQGIKIKDMKWIFNYKDKKIQLNEFLKGKQFAENFVYFVFNDIVIELLRSYFYCTERNSQRMKMYYYRKSVWSKVAKLAWNYLIYETKIFTKIPKMSVKELIDNSLPCGNVRILPKSSGVRPIINLGKKKSNEPATNHILKNTLSVMKFENVRFYIYILTYIEK